VQEQLPAKGTVHFELRGPDGELKDAWDSENLITSVGFQMYVDRALGIAGAPAAPTGMQLGTGTTAPATTGAGAAIVTLVASSLVTLTSTTTGAGTGTARRATYVATWGAGVATATGLAEMALVNQATGTQTAAPASATIARVLISPTKDKGAADTLTATWTHDIGS
jgi:hypothetical protein